MTSAWAKPHKQPVHKPDATGPSYVYALAAANRFLHAWQSADLENGAVLLSDGIRRSHNADKLEEFFASGTDRGFELTRGRRHSRRYIFPVVLVTTQSGKVSRRPTEIVLIEAGKNDWVVDRLP